MAVIVNIYRYEQGYSLVILFTTVFTLGCPGRLNAKKKVNIGFLH